MISASLKLFFKATNEKVLSLSSVLKSPSSPDSETESTNNGAQQGSTGGFADFAVSVNDLWNAVELSNSISDRQSTENGFKMLFQDFLRERGALPVGELGKMLQDCTGISTLSNTLKVASLLCSVLNCTVI